jgi:hypothetical protein
MELGRPWTIADPVFAPQHDGEDRMYMYHQHFKPAGSEKSQVQQAERPKKRKASAHSE